MDKTQIPIFLKQFLDALEVHSLEEYYSLADYINERTFRKGKILRPAGTHEDYAHFILKGMLALVQDRRLVRIYLPFEVAFDLDAYSNQSKSPYKLVALENSKVITVSRSAEEKILSNLPEFKTLSEKLISRAKKSDLEWIAITQMHHSEAIPLLREKMGQQFQIPSTKRLSEMLGISSKTLSRYYSKQYTNRKSILVRAQAKEIFHYPFHSIVHSDVEEIDSIVTCWASHHHLLPSQKAISDYQKMKMTWLSARLYPEATIEKSIWLAKLYAFLFIVDDYTDKTPVGEKHRFWMELASGMKDIMNEMIIEQRNKNLRIFLNAYFDLWKEFSLLASPDSRSYFKCMMNNYVRENQWEACNRDFRRQITIHSYLEKRPVFSGGILAIGLIKFAMENNHHDLSAVWQNLRSYQNLAAKLIFISNDLLSYEKEKHIEDPHNWLSLMIKEMGIEKEQAEKSLLEIHSQTLEELLVLDRKYQKNYIPNSRTVLTAIKNIKYQISGAVAWSVYDTKRYIEY
ncbi:cAMP-binding domain of CRP or a regulatory subunit of cAMP-dependent protein kinases [Aquiflexum balticum DSM 16537]|uniref:Terpene synthase n=1 Tax=Aquiflexum balticum DSM 16537 TaxID=758820 RepID=A0A1W2H677_9BACT|nr:hypothetical protein [Aquiflexum balticum]SMD44450.1 cAMP-binding domain of CRP or a regulatory subunit of cAMP-dependent protein kinases [Aquiflexum balticum DSM 16537]